MVSCFSSRCKFVVGEDLLSCSNELCPGKGQVFSAVTGFDLLVDLTDHTGTLQSCSLRSPAAETFLGCTVSFFTVAQFIYLLKSKVLQRLVLYILCFVSVISWTFLSSYMFQTEEFTRLTDDQRTTMKWKFLLERCKVYVKVQEFSLSRGAAGQATLVFTYSFIVS